MKDRGTWVQPNSEGSTGRSTASPIAPTPPFVTEALSPTQAAGNTELFSGPCGLCSLPLGAQTGSHGRPSPPQAPL